MADPQMDTKIPLRVVYPSPHARETSSPTRGDPLPYEEKLDRLLCEWRYLGAFCSMAHWMGLSSGANPLVWCRSRLPRGSGRAIKNHPKRGYPLF